MRCLHAGLLVAGSLFLCACAASPGAGPGTPTAILDKSQPVRSVPVTWARLGLTGKLVIAQINSGVWTLDLTTGEIRDVYAPPDLSQEWVSAAAVAPNGSDVVLAYAPRPKQGEVQFGYTELWLTRLDGSLLPRPLAQRQDPGESFFTPTWSSDGARVVYAHLTRATAMTADGTAVTFAYQIEQRSATGGDAAQLVADAYWPALAPNGQGLAYVAFSFQDAADGGLHLASLDGAAPVRLPAADAFAAVDAPLFVDDDTLLFGAPSADTAHVPEPLHFNWLEAPSASAHTVPSDWWRVELASPGQAQQVTHVGQTGLIGDVAPQGDWVAFMSDAGVFVMRPDGSQLTQIVDLGGMGSLEWLP